MPPTRHRDNLHFKMLTYHIHTNILFSCGAEHGWEILLADVNVGDQCQQQTNSHGPLHLQAPMTIYASYRWNRLAEGLLHVYVYVWTKKLKFGFLELQTKLHQDWSLSPNGKWLQWLNESTLHFSQLHCIHLGRGVCMIMTRMYEFLTWLLAQG